MSTRRKEARSWITTIGIALILFIVCRSFIFTPTVVKGSSMYPNLKNNDRLIVSKQSHIRRGDEIVFHSPMNPKEAFVKRVIGLPGDTIQIKDQHVYLNGKKLPETYIKANRKKHPQLMNDLSLETIPKNELFVMGDNRFVSYDSRAFGVISEDAVIGKVKIRFWPLNKITLYK